MLYHQQTISLQDAEGEFSEILLRMNGPQGEVLPGFFMPIAEKHNLTGAIDRWVLEPGHRAHCKAREAQGTPTTFFVKLTAASLQDNTLLPWLGERLDKAALKHGQLVLEMTESKVMTLLRPAQEFVNGLEEAGRSIRAGAVRLGPQLVPVAQPHRRGLSEDRPQLHGGPAAASGEPEESRRDLPARHAR